MKLYLEFEPEPDYDEGTLVEAFFDWAMSDDADEALPGVMVITEAGVVP